jgi:hypothetical protein
VAVLLAGGLRAGDVLSGSHAASARAVPGVPDGYVVRAADPLSALAVAEALRKDPRVRAAYPLVKRQRVPR